MGDGNLPLLRESAGSPPHLPLPHAGGRAGVGALTLGNSPGFLSVVVDAYAHPERSEKNLGPPLSTASASANWLTDVGSDMIF